jgi:cytochrome c oxidase subunit 3
VRRRWPAGRPPLKSSPDVWKSRQDLYRARLTFCLFLVSLAVFFTAGMVMYVVIRLQAYQPIRREYEPLQLPWSFVASTISLVLVSGFLHLAVACIRREQQSGFRTFLVLAWLAAAGFLVFQYFGMSSLLEAHFVRSDGSTKAFGMCFVLALLHALHVIGGMVFLGWVISRGFASRYDHERHYAVEHCAAYWHFLDVVWVVMLVVFVVTA